MSSDQPRYAARLIASANGKLSVFGWSHRTLLALDVPIAPHGEGFVEDIRNAFDVTRSAVRLVEQRVNAAGKNYVAPAYETTKVDFYPEPLREAEIVETDGKFLAVTPDGRIEDVTTDMEILIQDRLEMIQYGVEERPDQGSNVSYAFMNHTVPPLGEELQPANRRGRYSRVR
jgi:hypothetical protein